MSKRLQSLGTIVPQRMAIDSMYAKSRLEECVGGSIDNFVCNALCWTHEELCARLSQEQVEAVANIIYNFEARHEATIIGDQTGIGKGRVAACVIVYGMVHGVKPIFVTEKTNLFSDIYRDLTDIGAAEYKPFIINADSAQTHVRQMNGTSDAVVFRPLPYNEQKAVFESGRLPEWSDYVMATYSQFSKTDDEDDSSLKRRFAMRIAKGSILILDESHSAAGNSKRGTFFRSLADVAKHVCFLSATYSKRPENMALYLPHTCVSEAGLSSEELRMAIDNGGEALQEVLAEELVRNGQMLRREYDQHGIRVNYLTLDAEGATYGQNELNMTVEDLEKEHTFISDSIMSVVRDMLMVDRLVAQDFTNRTSAQRKPTRLAFSSRIYDLVGQMLLAIKADAVARHAVRRLRQGKAVVVAFSNTMEASLDSLIVSGTEVGSKVEDDFSYTLRRMLEAMRHYTIDNVDTVLDWNDMEQSKDAYLAMQSRLEEFKSGLTISPIDKMTRIIESAGFSVAEITGRKHCIDIDDAGESILNVRKTVGESYSKFQNNRVDCLLPNRSGATGASAHAIPTAQVADKEVRQRCMIVTQMELDINQEVQKRGRINRTGQILLPEYDYVMSAIPAEKRLMQMMRKKLLSLDANTSANQHNSIFADAEGVDLLNKFGDEATRIVLADDQELADALDIDITRNKTGLFSKASGRVAVLPVEQQKQFYDSVSELYVQIVNTAKAEGRYDIDVERFPLNAKLISRKIVEAPTPGGHTIFSDAVYLDCYECDNLRKPLSTSELKAEVASFANGAADAKAYVHSLYEMVADAVENEHKKAVDKVQTDLGVRLAQLLNVARLSPSFISTMKDVLWQLCRGQMDMNTALQNMCLPTEQRYINALNKYVNAMEALSAKKQKALHRYCMISYFYPGRQFVLDDNLKGCVLGTRIRTNENGKLRPSDITIFLATTDSQRILKYNLADAGYEILENLLYRLKNKPFEELLGEWAEVTKAATANRVRRYFLTGNILRAVVFKDLYHGRLVSFNVISDEGESRLNGVMLPSSFEPGRIATMMRSYSVSLCRRLFSLTENNDFVESVNFTLPNSGRLTIQKTARLGYGINLIIKDDDRPYTKAVLSHKYIDKHVYHVYEDANYSKTCYFIDFNTTKIEPFVDMLAECGVEIELDLNQAKALFGFDDNEALRDGWWPILEK